MTSEGAKRLVAGAASLACFAAALLLMPAGARSQLDVRSRDPIADTTPRLEAPPPPVAPERDAFAPRASVDEDPHPSAPALPPGPVRFSRPAIVMPPPLSPSRVTAIATGTRPTAIVESGGTSRVVTIGDAIDGSTIETIDEGTVVLVNGRHLSLEPAAATR
jgi:hypothetical protein